MSRPEKPEKYHSNLEDELKAKVRNDYVGHHDIDAKYLGKCSNHYYEYDECLRDLVGDNISCEVFRKGVQRCEEESGMYEDVLNNLGIVPEKRAYLKYTFDRTIESLKFHLWGLYHGENQTLDDLNIYHHDFYKKYQKHETAKFFNSFNVSEIMAFAPSEIRINPLAKDYELLTLEPFFCPNTDEMLAGDHREEFDFVMNLISYHVKYHTKNSFNAQQIYDLYDLIYANLYEGKDLIHNITTDSQVWNHIKHGAEYYVTYERYGSELKRKLYGMPLLQKIMKFLEESQEGTLPYELVLLSAHDITVFNLITALNIAHPKCFIDKMMGEDVDGHCKYPNYASQFLIELWDRNGEAKIKLLYEKEVVNLCGTQDGECSFSEFKEFFMNDYANLHIDDIFKHCGRVQQDDSPCEFNQEDW